MRYVTYGLMVVVVSVTSLRSARAEPITITAGSGLVNGPDSIHEGIGSLTLRGTGLDVHAGFHFRSNLPCESDGPGCLAGDLVTLSAPGAVEFESGPQVLNGIPVDLLSAEFEFVAAGSTAVPVGRGLIPVPITLTGHFVGYEAGVLRAEADVTGHGIASALFGRVEGARTDNTYLVNLTYEFGSAAPVPEPTTLILFATGAAAIGRKVSKRGREIRLVPETTNIAFN